MPAPDLHPVFAALRRSAAPRPLVAAHRGDSRHHPENTLAAFRAAASLGVAVQEFDVRQLACGALVCVHDATWDRTTDSARRFGPGLQVCRTDMATASQLDAGSWFGAGHTGERVPTLAAALAAIAPGAVPLIEHKAGTPEAYAAALQAPELAARCILQSFDWRFLEAVRALRPDLALGALGPNPAFPRPDDAALRTIAGFGAGLLHWHASELTRADVERAHAAGMLVCSYTTDDELGWRGGAALGIDVMCTNDPAGMLAALH